MKAPLYLIPALAALALTACKPSAEPLYSARIINNLSLPDKEEESVRQSLHDESRAVISHYMTTGDTRYASPRHGITMLHLAAMEHRLTLVQRLLEEGADPNAVMRLPLAVDGVNYSLQPAATPLIMATCLHDSNEAKDCLLVAKVLLRAGADINFRDPAGKGVLRCCSRRAWEADKWETLAMELIELGAQPNLQDAQHFADQRCFHALEKLLRSPEGEAWRREPGLLHGLAKACWTIRDKEYYPEAFLNCAQLILDAEGLDVNARRGRANTAPLFTATEHLQRVDDDEKIVTGGSFADFLALLLEKGADACQPANMQNLSTPADQLSACPPLKAALEERGFKLAPPAHRFTREKIRAELVDLPLEAVRDEEVREHWDGLASVFTEPSAALLACHEEHLLLATKALRLLYRADAARAQALILSRPCWREEAAWQDAKGELSVLRQALQNVETAALPASWLRESALFALKAGQPIQARFCVRLMDRCPAEEAAPLLEELCAEDQPLALRAPAWSAKVHHEGLPAFGPFDGSEEIFAWWNMRDRSYENQRSEAVSVAFNAEDAASTDCFIIPGLPYGHEDRTRRWESEASALQQIGAEAALRLYDEEGTRTDEPSPEEKLHAALELELKLAQYILKHREDFLHPAKRVPYVRKRHPFFSWL